VYFHAHNFARRLQTLRGLTPYEFLCKTWTAEPERFILNPCRDSITRGATQHENSAKMEKSSTGLNYPRNTLGKEALGASVDAYDSQ